MSVADDDSESVRIVVQYGDGATREWRDLRDAIMDGIEYCEGRGLSGAALLDELFGRPWPRPPRCVEFSWLTPKGEAMKMTIPYQ